MDRFFDLVARRLAPALGGLPQPGSSPRRWVVMEDDEGVELSELEGMLRPVHEVLASFIEAGATAAAFVTHVGGDQEHLLAYVLVSAPRASDVRRADVIRESASVRLAPWEPTV